MDGRTDEGMDVKVEGKSLSKCCESATEGSPLTLLIHQTQSGADQNNKMTFLSFFE